ncbi:MAG: cytochrome c3 family protein [Deltaproteobacteria bacterium]|nr:cytochrome c3 family protein [Deltaproteobacteria bacterium]
MKKFGWILVVPSVVVVALASALAFAADVPADKQEITINLLGGKQGPVKFPHAKHSKEFKKNGEAITCKSCHHTLKADTDKPEACHTCHVKPGETEKEFDGKKAIPMAVMKGDKADMKTVIFHKTCLDGCHKVAKVEGKNLTACKTCHAK